MALNLYVTPMIGTGAVLDPRRPAYQATVYPTFHSDWFDYGNEPWALVGIVNIDAATDTTLQAQSQVFAIPANLDQAIGGGSRARVQNNLEGVNIPGTWVQSTTTWREVVRFVGAVCNVAQAYQGSIGGLWFTGGVTLDTTFSALPSATQNGLVTIAQHFLFDTSILVAASTLRQILKSLGDQYVSKGYSLTLANTPL